MSTTTAGGSSGKESCHCKNCGGTDICFRGDVAWDVEAQSFYVLDPDAWAWCNVCDTEVEVAFKTIKFAYLCKG